jgi:diguanylate cyclase (GGDEF)-like protein
VELLPSGSSSLSSAGRSSVLFLDDPTQKEDDRSRNELTVVATAGLSRSDILGKKVRPVDGLAGFVYARGERTAVNEMAGARALSRELDHTLEIPVKNALGVPVVIENHVCGSLVLLNSKESAGFAPRDERLMELFGDTLSLALQNLLDERRAREVARRDSLTALYNDRYFHKRLQQEINKLHQASNGDLVLLFMDCDHLKAVNDEHGHLAGSQVLREFAYVLQRSLSDASCLPCRYGGDEFTVILFEADLARGLVIAERIRKNIQDWIFLPMSLGPEEPALCLKGVLTISIGVASYRVHCAPGKSAADQKNALLKKSDTALYAAKMRGKNCVVAAGEGEAVMPTSAVILKS